MKNQRNADADERNRTQPWHKDEFCTVNGMDMVYRWNYDNEMEVMVPGRRRGFTIRQLRDSGYAVRLPITVRACKDLGVEQ